MGAVSVPRKKSASEPYEMTRFSTELLRKARTVLAYTSQKVSLGKYISEKAREGIEADYVKLKLPPIDRSKRG